MREFLRVLGAVAVVFAIFYGTLFALPQPPESPLAQQAASLRNALQAYRNERLAYPTLPDNPIGDLQRRLIADGYLHDAPDDLDKDARYVSLDGKSYGLLFHIDGEKCLIEVDIRGTGWWGRPRGCPF